METRVDPVACFVLVIWRDKDSVESPQCMFVQAKFAAHREFARDRCRSNRSNAKSEMSVSIPLWNATPRLHARRQFAIRVLQKERKWLRT